MHPTLVLNVVGLTPDLLGAETPCLAGLARQGRLSPLSTITPAVTCSVQASLTTGLLPRDHGIVANGWYYRDLAEVAFWRQSNRLVHGEQIWDAGRKRNSQFTCATLFWWFNMYSSADFTVTPRPIYRADGGKLPDIYTRPTGLRDDLNRRLGPFPLVHFWGPAADIRSSQWIVDCARHIYDSRKPTLTLVYLPHLDYSLQRMGPGHHSIRNELRRIDAVCGGLIDHVRKDGTRVIVLSEYGITAVTGPVHLNRVLREAGLLAVRDELGRELLDPGASEAFAVADHQIAHVYVRHSDRISEVRRLLEGVPGVESVLDREGKRQLGLDHPRSGELIALAGLDRWFSYYYWLDEERAPDFARTVDIHRKPGYDPVELFIDPKISRPKLRIAWRLFQKKVGFRVLMDVIGVDATLPRGSHGRLTEKPEQGPLFMTSEPELLPQGDVSALDVKSLILRHVFSDQVPGTTR